MNKRWPIWGALAASLFLAVPPADAGEAASKTDGKAEKGTARQEVRAPVRPAAGAKGIRSAAPDGQETESFEVQGTVGSREVHSYYFETLNEAVIHIAPFDPSATVSITPADRDGEREVYADGSRLPAGAYYLSISAFEEVSSYRFTVSGPTFRTVDATLPELSVDQPADGERLPKNSNIIKVKGTFAGGDSVSVHLDGRLAGKSVSNPYSLAFPAPLGPHALQVCANEDSGSRIVRHLFVNMPGTERIGGKDRYEVSAGVSRETFPSGADTVVLARGDLFTDALAGGPLAFDSHAPLLITRPEALPAPIEKEIIRLNPKKAIILGGAASVSLRVEQKLRSLGIQTERIGGANRFEVSANIARRIISRHSASDVYQAEFFAANGLNFPDALTASAAGRPILLVRPDRLPPETEAFLRSEQKRLFRITVVGGPASVSESVKQKLNQFVGLPVTRIGGKNRYEVSVNFYKAYADLPQAGVLVAKGTDFPDALSGGAVASARRAGILLTPPAAMDPSVRRYVESRWFNHMYFLGGPGSISREVEARFARRVQ